MILINDHQNLERGALTVIDVSDEANGPLMEHNIFASQGFTIRGHSALLEGRKPWESIAIVLVFSLPEPKESNFPTD